MLNIKKKKKLPKLFKSGMPFWIFIRGVKNLQFLQNTWYGHLILLFLTNLIHQQLKSLFSIFSHVAVHELHSLLSAFAIQ